MRGGKDEDFHGQVSKWMRPPPRRHEEEPLTHLSRLLSLIRGVCPLLRRSAMAYRSSSPLPPSFRISS